MAPLFAEPEGRPTHPPPCAPPAPSAGARRPPVTGARTMRRALVLVAATPPARAAATAAASSTSAAAAAIAIPTATATATATPTPTAPATAAATAAEAAAAAHPAGQPGPPPPPLPRLPPRPARRLSHRHGAATAATAAAAATVTAAAPPVAVAAGAPTRQRRAGVAAASAAACGAGTTMPPATADVAAMPAAAAEAGAADAAPSPTRSPPLPPPLLDDSKEERAAFLSAFDTLSGELVADVRSTYGLPPAAADYLAQVISYNVPHGKLTRGLAVGACFRAVAAASPAGAAAAVTPAAAQTARLLGWCVELLQACFLVADDIMDDSVTRRGRPCWYRRPEIGLKAVNDALLLEGLIYRVVKRHLGGAPCYGKVLELFHDATFTTEVGQLLDLTTMEGEAVGVGAGGDVDTAAFTPEALRRIYHYKTAHYSFYLPVALGMALAGAADGAEYDAAREVCMELGAYFQATDDYLDAFGDPAVTGKVGTDIEDRKVTWLAVDFLGRAPPAAVAEWRRLYGGAGGGAAAGGGGGSAVARVKELYVEAGVVAAYHTYEEASYTRIQGMIEGGGAGGARGALEFLLAKIYRRSK